MEPKAQQGVWTTHSVPLPQAQEKNLEQQHWFCFTQKHMASLQITAGRGLAEYIM